MPVWSLNSIRTDRAIIRTIALLLSVLLCSAAAAQPRLGSSGGLGAEPEFLPADEAFRWHVSRPAEDRVVITWEIAPDYYLYREQFRFSLAGNDSPLAFSLPDGDNHHDAYFGDVEVYYNGVDATITLPQPLPAGAELQVRYQGCAEAGLCYPPEQQHVPLTP